MLFDKAVLEMLGVGILESLYMTLVSSLFAYLLGLPLGVLLTTTKKDGIYPIPWLNRTLDIFVNLTRSVPFLILMVAVIPFTRRVVGKAIGSTAAIVPLVLSAAPYVARLVESSLLEVDCGVIEAAQSMGASPLQIVYKVLLSEALPSLINGCAIATTTILAYSAMAGAVGGGGLGSIAISYGYNRYKLDIMLATVVLLIALVQIIQAIGSGMARICDHRK